MKHVQESPTLFTRNIRLNIILPYVSNRLKGILLYSSNSAPTSAHLRPRHTTGLTTVQGTDSHNIQPVTILSDSQFLMRQTLNRGHDKLTARTMQYR